MGVTLDQKQSGKRSRIDRFLISLFPTLSLESEGFKSLWDQEQDERFRLIIQYSSVIYAAAYVFHYFVVDSIESTPNPVFFAFFRFGLAAFAGVLFVLSILRFPGQARTLRALTLIYSALVVLLQAAASIFETRIDPLWAYLLVPVTTLMLQFSVVPAALYALTLNLASTYLYFKYLPIDDNLWRTTVSAVAVSTAVTIFLRMRFSQDVEIFRLNQILLRAKQQDILKANEMLEQVRTFMPRELYSRMLAYQSTHKATIAAAMDEVLRPQTKFVACLWTDIRAFTKNSHDPAYLMNGAVAGNQRVTEAVDQFRGIPRLMGDLVLAYYDFERPELNVLLALATAKAATRRSMEVATNVSSYKRYVVLTLGEAVVGNIGSRSGTKEITCLGPSVNLCQRLDEATKKSAIQNAIPQFSVILSSEFAELARTLFPGVRIGDIDLAPIQVTVRDYPGITQLHYLAPDQLFAIQIQEEPV